MEPEAAVGNAFQTEAMESFRKCSFEKSSFASNFLAPVHDRFQLSQVTFKSCQNVENVQLDKEGIISALDSDIDSVVNDDI